MSTTSRRRIVLYYPKLADDQGPNPPGTDVLPLSVLQIAGWPLRDGYEVVVVDGNLHAGDEAHRRVLEACEGALLLGVTGILGYQVLDGMRCAERARAKYPRLPRVVGGWFAAVTPGLHLEGGRYDAVVHGQVSGARARSCARRRARSSAGSRSPIVPGS